LAKPIGPAQILKNNMNEYQSMSQIKWPQTKKVEVGPSVDFIYIMRKDGNSTMSPIAHKLSNEYHVDEYQTKQILLGEYDTFFANLADTLQWSYSSKGNFELHLYDPNYLDESIRDKAHNIPIVSLDSLMHDDVLEHMVSRGYYLGGKKDFGQIARPGTDSLSQQANQIALSLKGAPAFVVEDDIFSGGSVIASLTQLKKNGVIINKLIPGIQVGKPSKLLEMGIPVDPVIAYETTDGTDIFDKVDLGDPRDYLLGASGLVVKLTNGNYGRAPYILPFVSTTARAGIPQEIEKEFAAKVLQANLEFFNNVKVSIGKSILLKNMNSAFVVLMNEMFGFDSNTPMEQIVVWSMNNMDSLWEITKAQGEFQEKLSGLKLPQNIVFIDVNGTLISEDSKDGHISQKDLQLLHQALTHATEKGVSIGFCSDSPLPQLQGFAEKLGIKGPIVAENGNLVSHDGKTLIINSLDNREVIKALISEQASTICIQDNDCIAPEFGGQDISPGSTTWSFGANRQTSITVFGPAYLISYLGDTFKDVSMFGFGIDASPDQNYFAIHPGGNFKANKGKTLDVLSAYGHNIIMVGNSASDWVEPTLGVQCTFVAGSRIDAHIIENAAFISDKPIIQGVIDILEHIQ